ncbi:4495_t:CDS:2 [Paraglomus brasilianum]|uniref:4495_t:CDS:1 n=1 Tax=Paraglomus brasilianum TaxID=144538 RepID=A0A9N9DIX0_9GLOM|nr:4495_t:CDS:2 [Paraglomus brasilianum]
MNINGVVVSSFLENVSVVYYNVENNIMNKDKDSCNSSGIIHLEGPNRLPEIEPNNKDTQNITLNDIKSRLRFM